jgi:FkbM family methyltransferase
METKATLLMPNDYSTRVRLLGRAFRMAPSWARGKGRLARFLLNRKIRDNPVEIGDRDGNVMMLPNIREPLALSLWLDGFYEPDVLSFLRASVGPRSVVVDVGANIGALTVPLARTLDRGGSVVAIEAAPTVASFLKRNVERNRLRNVTVVQCAVSTGESASVLFYEAPPNHFGRGSCAQQFDIPPIQVPAKSLDRILDENRVSEVAAIKVDVEGYEAHVFQGADQILKSPRRPRIVFEFCDWAEERAFPGRRGWAQEILLGRGYKLWLLSDFLAGRQPLEAPVREGFCSIVALPDQN